MIPKNIHLIYIRDTKEYPVPFHEYINKIKEFHMSWNIRLYDKDDALKILKEHLPQCVEPYQKLKYNIQKADFLRIALVYIYGGFYMDLDMVCLKPLDDLLNHKVVLGQEKMMSLEDRQRLGLIHELRVANYMFGGEPGQDFYHNLMKQFIAFAELPVNNQEDMLENTGPGLLTNFYHENKHKYPEICLLMNTDRKCMHSWHNEIACHFGDYAAHLHAGSWRNDVPV